MFQPGIRSNPSGHDQRVNYTSSHLLGDGTSQDCRVHIHVAQVIVEVQRVDGDVPVLPRARRAIRNAAPNVPLTDVPSVEDLWLHVLEVPVHDELVRRQLHNRVSVVRHAEEAIAKLGVEVLRPIVQLLDLIAVTFHGQSREARHSRAQRVARHPRGFGAGATLASVHGLLDALLQALPLLKEAAVHLAVAALRPSGAGLPEFEVRFK